MSKFFVHNFGCRASQADGAAIESLLLGFDMQASDQMAGSGLVVLQTCTVTARADAELRQMVRRVHAESPEARIVLTGCQAQRSPEELAQLPGVTLVVGNSHQHLLPELLKREVNIAYHGELAGTTVEDVAVAVGEIAQARGILTSVGPALAADRTRPFLKIQDGCNSRCSFCVIPSVRGRSRSLSSDEVVAKVSELAQTFHEVVLTGINLGRWGREVTGGGRIADLVARLLAETEVRRLRLSSIEPMDWSDSLIDLMAGSDRIARHVHAPLQSGSDAVLKRMRRRYRTRHYADRVERVRRLLPDAAIGADVMTGFPGESDAEFEETQSFIREMPFTYLHVFSYSERPGTEAAELGEGVPVALRRQRNRQLQELSSAKGLEFRRTMVGRTLPAITLREPYAALTSNYLKVRLARHRSPNEMVDLLIGGLMGTSLLEAGALPILV